MAEGLLATWLFMGWLPAMYFSGERVWLFLLIWWVPCIALMVRTDMKVER